MISDDFSKTSIALMDLTNINLDNKQFYPYKNSLKLSFGLSNVLEHEFKINTKYKVTLGENSFMERYFNPKMELINQTSVDENDIYII